MQVYHVDWKVILSVVCASAALMVMPLFSSKAFNHDIIPFVVGLPIFVLLDLRLGTFVRIDNRRCSFTEFFIIKHKIAIREITNIRYLEWRVKGNNSLYISSDTDGKMGKFILIFKYGFGEKTIARIINDLAQRNTEIELDEGARALMRKYAC